VSFNENSQIDTSQVTVETPGSAGGLGRLGGLGGIGGKGMGIGGTILTIIIMIVLSQFGGGLSNLGSSLNTGSISNQGRSRCQPNLQQSLRLRRHCGDKPGGMRPRTRVLPGVQRETIRHMVALVRHRLRNRRDDGFATVPWGYVLAVTQFKAESVVPRLAIGHWTSW
jgi:hypothetical protein